MTSTLRRWGVALRRPLFVVTVLVPTLVAAVYLWGYASDVYVSESRFVVRSIERPAINPLGSLLKSTGLARAQDESFSVQEYMLSRDALHILDKDLSLGASYSTSNVDRWNRFGGIDPDVSFEALHRYYQKMIKVQTDSASAVTTLQFHAFDAGLAQKANETLLKQSEALVNRLNERGRKNLLEYALADVAQAEQRARTAALAVATYRTSRGVVDPEKQAAVQLQQSIKLEEELAATRMQLNQAKSLAPLNPQVDALKTREAFLEDQLNQERSRVTGGRSSLADRASEFQRLALEAEFSNRQLAAAMANLDAVKNEALRQQIYIERIAQPSLADAAQEPRRFKGVMATLVLGLIVWMVLQLLLAGIREHQEY